MKISNASYTLSTTSKIVLVAAVMSTALMGCNRRAVDEPSAAMTPSNTNTSTAATTGAGGNVNKDTTTTAPGTMVAPMTAGSAPMASAAGIDTSGAAAAGTTATGAGVTLTDAQIEGILMAADTGEINAAKMAESKSKNAKVKDFARSMVKDHTDNDQKVASLSKKEKISADESDLSRMLKDNAAKEAATLKPLSGVDFDKTYIDAQVSDHETVLKTIDSSLMPNAKNAELKALLQKTRTAVAMHLEHAKSLQTASK